MEVRVDIRKIRDKSYKQEILKKITNDKTLVFILKKFNADVVKVTKRKFGLLKTYSFMSILNDDRKWFLFLEDCPQLRVKKNMLLPYREDIEDKLINEYETSFLVVAFLESKKSNKNPNGKVICKEVIFE